MPKSPLLTIILGLLLLCSVGNFVGTQQHHQQQLSLSACILHNNNHYQDPSNAPRIIRNSNNIMTPLNYVTTGTFSEKKGGRRQRDHYKDDNDDDDYPPPMANFVVHIPKTGGWALGRRLLAFYEEVYNVTNTHAKKNICLLPYHHMQGSLKDYPHHYRKKIQTNGQTCHVWVSEAQPPDHDGSSSVSYTKKLYTMIRDPYEHLVSQYFHCKESPGHADRSHYMPTTLKEWLHAWVMMTNSSNITTTTTSVAVEQSSSSFLPTNATTPMMMIPSTDALLFNDEHFRCYHAWNFQSIFVKHLQEETMMMTTLSSSSDNKEATRMYADLSLQFDFIGLNKEMDKSSCILFIHSFHVVPKSCDCSRRRRLNEKVVMRSIRNNNNKTKLTTASTKKRQQQTRSRSANNNNKNNNDKVMTDNSHGVKHHGSSYNTTIEERSLMDQLTKWDQRLFQHAQILFQKEVDRIEKHYKIRLCKKIF